MLAVVAPMSLSYAPVVVSRAGPIKAVAEGVAPDFSDKPWTSGEVKDAAGLKELAKKLNPVVGYWGAPSAGPGRGGRRRRPRAARAVATESCQLSSR